MKLAHLSDGEHIYPVFVHEGQCVALHDIEESEQKPLPTSIDNLILHQDFYEKHTRDAWKKLCRGAYLEFAKRFPESEAYPAILSPSSTRDAYAFRQHVETSRRNRGVQMIPEFDEFPVFYFTNHNAMVGAGELAFMPRQFERLDFELEAAVVLGKIGRNIKASEADDYIYGLMCMNDWSARSMQMEEMKLNLGPAKGKDFATGIGPMLVTVDELTDYEVAPKPGHVGKAWKLVMDAWVNGEHKSHGVLSDMDWTFAEIIERVSYGVSVFPTDVIGSGTVGTGCFLELNGTAKLENPDTPEQWLEPGDEVKIFVKELGILGNIITKE